MRSYTSRRFREMYANLPGAVQRQARPAYRLFLQSPSHPGLNFEMDGNDIVWFWIGPHREYEKTI